MDTIVIDTREQKPWSFSPQVATVRKSLPAGDYSIVGYETMIAIERKSIDDLVNTLVHDRVRFQEELRQLRNYFYASIVVEGALGDIMRKRYTSLASVESVLGLMCSINVDWKLPILFAGNRGAAAAISERLMRCAANRVALKRSVRQALVNPPYNSNSFKETAKES